MKNSLLILKHVAFVSTLICLCILEAFAQGRFDDVVITETKLTDQIYMLEGAGGNIGLFIGESEILMIDDQYAPLADRIKAKIAELSGGRTATQVINTHWHGDHTGGNENFGADGAMIFAHENVRTRMAASGQGDQQTAAVALPVVTYSDDMQLYFLDEPILVSHVHTAHTDGDSFVFFPESNVIHMGDCFFHQRYPYIDPGSGGSLNGMISAVEAALMLVNDDTQIIPGHGPMATKADLQNYHTFLVTIRERIVEHVSNGRDISTLDTDKFVEGYEEWAWSFIDAERFKVIAHDALVDDK